MLPQIIINQDTINNSIKFLFPMVHTADADFCLPFEEGAEVGEILSTKRGDLDFFFSRI